jgi:integrase
MSLSIKKIERMKPGERKSDGNNLYLQSSPTGVKSWVFRYVVAGKERWCGLGPLHTYNLAEARELARLARQQLKSGIDPIEARREMRAAEAIKPVSTMTFREAAKEFNRLNEAKWRNPKSRKQFLSSLERFAFPTIGHLPVAAIDTPLVLKCLQPRWLEVPETLSRVRGRIETVLGWAAASGYRPPGENPARWSKHLAAVLPGRNQVAKVQHFASMPYRDVAQFMADLAAREGIAAKALAFTVLCASRTGETIGARWSEFDLEERVWLIPGTRMKAGRPHRVPLSDAALAVLQSVTRQEDNEFVFPGTRYGEGLSNMALTTVLRRMEISGATVHGFRSSFRVWAAERGNFPDHIVEAALAHTISDAVVRAYKRTDLFAKRKAVMDAWARYCTSPVAKSGVVLPMRSKA